MLSLARLAAGSPRVFPSHPRADGYFPSQVAERARTQLLRCLERGEGPALLIGAPGVGKSSLLCALHAQLAERFHVASLTSVQLCTRRALLQSILFSLGQPYRHREEGELRIALLDYLANDPESKNGTVLLVDEAQALPQRLLEELRMLGNLAPSGEASVRLLLVGGPQLEETFAAPENEAFSQRIGIRSYLAPLSHGDTQQYVRALINAAGGDADQLIADDALDAVYHATDGIPRLINQVCDRALVLASDARYERIERAVIETAWADLQQLPTPWEMPSDAPNLEAAPGDDSQLNVVEFGPLSDDAKSSSETIPAVAIANEPDVEEEEYGPPAEREDEAIAGVVAAEAANVVAATVASHGTVNKSFDEPTRNPNRSYADPFGEEFEDEELVIESFASMDALLPPSATRVENCVDGGATSRCLATVVQNEPPAATAVADEVEADISVDDHNHLAIFADQTEQLSEEVDESSDVDDDLELLIVENDDVPVGVVSVDQRDYRQLFAKLRRG